MQPIRLAHLVDKSLDFLCINGSCVLHKHEEKLGKPRVTAVLCHFRVFHDHRLAQLICGAGTQALRSEL